MILSILTIASSGNIAGELRAAVVLGSPDPPPSKLGVVKAPDRKPIAVKPAVKPVATNRARGNAAPAARPVTRPPVAPPPAESSGLSGSKGSGRNASAPVEAEPASPGVAVTSTNPPTPTKVAGDRGRALPGMPRWIYGVVFGVAFMGMLAFLVVWRQEGAARAAFEESESDNNGRDPGMKTPKRHTWVRALTGLGR